MSRKRPLSESESQWLSFLEDRCGEQEVKAVMEYDPDVLLKMLSGLTEIQKRHIWMRHRAVHDALRDIELMETKRRSQHAIDMEATHQLQVAEMEATRRLQVENMLSGFPQIELHKLMTKLLPSSLFNRSHEDWKAWCRKYPKSAIVLPSDDDDRKLLQEAIEILMESTAEAVVAADNTTHTMNIKADIVEFKFAGESEFNPTKSIYLREEYQEIWLALQ